MVAFRYEKWDEDLLRRMKEFASLMAIFQHLLLQANGDVQRTLQYMKRLQEMGYLDKNADLAQFRASLAEKQLIDESKPGFATLTSKGERMIRQDALNRIFNNLKRGTLGEHLTSCATVLLLDISHSMILYGEDRITPAKKVALAMAELIQTRYPKDSLQVALFGDDATEVAVRQLPYVGAGPYHTNTRAALQLAQRLLLRKKHPNRQIFMVTDGKPSAITENGKLYQNPFGLDPKIVGLTLEEAAACRRNKIVITTFMLTQEPALVDFVNKLTQVNKGRAYFSAADNLGGSVFVDYLRNRKKKIGH